MNSADCGELTACMLFKSVNFFSEQQMIHCVMLSVGPYDYCFILHYLNSTP